MKICLLTERFDPQPGGVAVAATRLAKLLVDAGHEVHVIHPEAGGQRLEAISTVADGMVLHRLSIEQWDRAGFEALYRGVVWLHGVHGFDVLHAFFLTMAQVVHFANHHPRLPHRPRWAIASARGSDALDRIYMPWWRDNIREALAAPTTWLTSVNRFYVDYLERGLGLDLSQRSTVIYNGVRPIDASQRWRLGPHNRGVVGTVGAFRPIKDVPLLVRGYAGVPPSSRRGLLLAGFFEPDEPEEQAWTRCLIDEFGLAAEVEETGRFAHAEVGAYLRRMHVYVQSSAYEGLPNALLEAASHGVPLVATAVGGVAEIIDDGDTGLLVPHGDPHALTLALRRVLDSDELTARLSAGALRLADRYSLAHEAESWRRLYEHLQATPPAAERVRLAALAQLRDA